VSDIIRNVCGPCLPVLPLAADLLRELEDRPHGPRRQLQSSRRPLRNAIWQIPYHCLTVSPDLNHSVSVERRRRPPSRVNDFRGGILHGPSECPVRSTDELFMFIALLTRVPAEMLTPGDLNVRSYQGPMIQGVSMGALIQGIHA
jgi:hypothetical protein